jgi:hypothetical protein
MTLVVLLSAAAVVAVGGYVRSRARAARPGACHSGRCPRSDKKFRYPARFAGRLAPCPACKRRLILPLAPQQPPGARGRVEGYTLRRKGAGAVCQPAP